MLLLPPLFRDHFLCLGVCCDVLGLYFSALEVLVLDAKAGALLYVGNRAYAFLEIPSFQWLDLRTIQPYHWNANIRLRSDMVLC